ncbi:unnamed protein product [Durusdinium trenchii]|uniref:Uncharacterized protein n=1 Tax=Durusdinium trenchii TaxID=1381693 RepID=A0ABP0L9P9_9DINO
MPQSHVESGECSEAHDEGQDLAIPAAGWTPQLGSKTVKSTAREEDSMSHQDSPLSTRPFPTLADLRLQVDERLHEAIKGGAFQGTTRSRSENSRLRWELRAARCELEQGEVEAAWQQEVEFWKAEVSRLEAELLELKQHRASAEALGKGLQKVQPTPPTSQARHEDDASETARWFGRGCGEDDTKKWR